MMFVSIHYLATCSTNLEHLLTFIKLKSTFIKSSFDYLMMMMMIIIIIIQPLGQFGQEPEPSQATDMALVRCVLGKFLGVVCHCFPPRLDFPTFAARCLHVRIDAAKGGTMGEKGCPVILPTWRLYSRH